MEGYAKPAQIDLSTYSGSGWDGDGWIWETDQSQAPKPDRTDGVADSQQSTERHLIRAVAPTESFPPKPLAPSRMIEEDEVHQSPLGGDQGQSFKRGLLIHKLLELLPDLPEQARRKAAERFLAQPIHALDPDQQAEIANETLGIFDNPAFAPVFAPGSRAEVPLVGIVGGDVVSAQIDRLVVRDDEVMIVDYKTNRPPPRDVEDTPRAYRRQMSIYRAALAQMYPGKTVRCFILWTNGPWMVELPEHILTFG
tara:strand:- start:72 stop:830 length:759 start_codon:yes stop_codon:yes gene_type:complete